LKEMGFDGVQNFPTVGLFDGRIRAYCEETGFGYGLEVDMIREAHALEMLTCPYVFDEDEAVAMARAGADVLVPHMGTTVKGAIGAQTSMTLDEAAQRVQRIRDAAVRIRPDILVLCHGGPIAEPEDAQYIFDHTEGIAGFFGASSIERLAAEPAIEAQTRRFKELSVHRGDG
jgi:predicted TIM-barrel enzyme